MDSQNSSPNQSEGNPAESTTHSGQSNVIQYWSYRRYTILKWMHQNFKVVNDKLIPKKKQM
ncbi:hypothetical protein HUJ05_002741 [Dendroctonus ponderosae]|nr:hypothetical protein HUJ05_002741 [Dendroctonus ponderosae]